MECSALFQVVDGAYNGAKLSFTDQAVLTDNGLDKNSGYSVPLEIMPSGQFEPLYRTTLSVQVQNSYFYFCAFHAIASSKTFFFSMLYNFHFPCGRMENCQFFHYLFTGQLQWHTVRFLRTSLHHISFSSISMIKEM